MDKLVDRRSYWIRSSESELMTHAHIPATKRGSMAVLVCGTIGFEAIHAYRCFVHLADDLAAHNIPAFRFDFGGTGNSSGDAVDRDLVAQWQQNIVDQVADLRENWHFDRIAVVGFRLGAVLLSSVLDRIDVTAVTFWEPVTRGKSFVREIRAAARFASDQAAETAVVLESGGFAFSDDTMAAMQSLTLDSAAIPAGLPVMLVSRGTYAEFSADAFDKDNPLSEFRTREYEKMICEPHYTELPIESIERITSWHLAQGKSFDGGFDIPDHRQTAVFSSQDSDNAVVEFPFRESNGRLFGIVTRPTEYVEGTAPTVVFSNAGSVCSVGPNRVYVQVARALAASGIEVARFDIRNLGDSVIGDVREANVPYPDTASDDVGYILQHCRKVLGAKSFILAGLCSGSHTSYHFGLSHDDSDVHELILINPLTYYWTVGNSLENPLQHQTVSAAKFYSRAVRNKENWRRLLTGKIDYRRLLWFKARISAQTVAYLFRKIGHLWSEPSLSQMDKDLLRLEDRGLRVSYVFSDKDPGHWIAKVDSPNTFRSQEKSGISKVYVLADADHTLSKARNRQDLIHVLREHISIPQRN